MTKADAQQMGIRITDANHKATVEEIMNLNGGTGVWKCTGYARDPAVGVSLNAAKTLQDGTPGVTGTVREVIYI